MLEITYTTIFILCPTCNVGLLLLDSNIVTVSLDFGESIFPGE